MTNIIRAAFWGTDGRMLAESTGAHAQRAYDAALAASARRHGAPVLNAVPDPLTVAYIAIGAQIEYRYSNGQDITGQSEYIDSCIQHAPMLDRLAPQVEETGAHFYYEFAEAFGARYGAALLAGKTPDAAVVAAEIITELPQS